MKGGLEIKPIEKSEVQRFVLAMNRFIDATIQLPAEAIIRYQDIWNTEQISDCVETHVLLQALNEQGEIVGVVLGTPPEGGVATIIWVLVSPDHQGQGIGRNLLEKAWELYAVKGAHKVKLTVPDERTTQFYIKQGLTLEGYHPNHWWESDFWSMAKMIKS